MKNSVYSRIAFVCFRQKFVGIYPLLDPIKDGTSKHRLLFVLITCCELNYDRILYLAKVISWMNLMG